MVMGSARGEAVHGHRRCQGGDQYERREEASRSCRKSRPGSSGPASSGRRRGSQLHPRPDRREPNSPRPRRGQGGAKRYLAIGAMVLAVLLLVGPFARPTVVFALLLIGVGVLLMVQDRPEQAPGSASPWPPGSPTPAAGGGQQPG